MAIEWYTFTILMITFAGTAVNFLQFPWFRRTELGCQEFFHALRNVRDDVLLMPYRPDNYTVDIVEEHLQATMGMSMYNDTELRTLACDVVEANTVDDLSVVLRVDRQYVEMAVSTYKEDTQNATGIIHHFEVDILKKRAWLLSSGFPDTWPLMTKFRENLALVETCEHHHELFFYAGHGLTASEKAGILSDAKSLDGFFKTLKVNPADSYVKQILQMIKFLASAEGGVAVRRAAQSTVEFRKAVKMLSVVQRFRHAPIAELPQ